MTDPRQQAQQPTPHPYRCCEICANVPCKPINRIECVRERHTSASQQRIEALDDLRKRLMKLRVYTDDTFEEGKFLERDAVLKAIALLRAGE